MALTRWIACFDSHGDCIDPSTESAFRQFVKDFRPTLRVHGGDAFDLRWLRRSCSDDEKAESVAADFQAGLDFLKWYAPDVFLWGNHDQRLRDALDHASNGALRQLAGEWIDRIEVATPGCKHFPYDKRAGVYRLGNLSMVHGYCHGLNAVRKSALIYGHVLMGHVHRVEAIRVERHDGAWGYCAGCLCKLDFPYNRANLGTLAQEHGWAYGVTDRKETTVWLARKTGGRWVLPSEMRTLN